MAREKKSCLPTSLRSEHKLHLRLCHFCFHLNESYLEVSRCERCKRSLTLASLISDFTEEDEYLDKMDQEEGEDVTTESAADEKASIAQPSALINGLSVLW